MAFHNTPYGTLFRESENHGAKITDLLEKWTPQHRIVWVDACMAPYELLAPIWQSVVQDCHGSRYSTTLSSFDLAQSRTTKILEPPNHPSHLTSCRYVSTHIGWPQRWYQKLRGATQTNDVVSQQKKNATKGFHSENPKAVQNKTI